MASNFEKVENKKKKGKKIKRKDVKDSRGRKKKFFVCRCLSLFVRSFVRSLRLFVVFDVPRPYWRRLIFTKAGYEISYMVLEMGSAGQFCYLKCTSHRRAVVSDGKRAGGFHLEGGWRALEVLRRCGDQDRSVDPNLKGYYSWVVQKVPKKLAHKSHRFELLDVWRATLKKSKTKKKGQKNKKEGCKRQPREKKKIFCLSLFVVVRSFVRSFVRCGCLLFSTFRARIGVG